MLFLTYSEIIYIKESWHWKCLDRVLGLEVYYYIGRVDVNATFMVPGTGAVAYLQLPCSEIGGGILGFGNLSLRSSWHLCQPIALPFFFNFGFNLWKCKYNKYVKLKYCSVW